MSISSLSYIHQIDETMSENIPTGQDKVQRYVVKFVDNLKQLSPTYRFKLFSKRIHSIVADKAAYFGFYLNKGMVSQQPTQLQRLKYYVKNSRSLTTQLLCKLILYLKSKDMVLNPGGSFLCYWESLVLFLSILNIMYIPLSVCFSIDKSDLLITHILLGYLPSVIFLLDMAMSFFKAYYEKGVMRNTKSEMFWHYVKGDLFFDICVVLPFFLEAFGVKSTNYFMLLRVTRIKRTFDTIEETFNFQEKSAALFELVYLICFVVMASHFCACMFHYIAYLERQHGYEYTWQDAQHIADAHWTTKYIYSLYFTAITSMTVGYGDVVPVTNPERVFVTVITYLVTGVFGYVISSIGSIVFKLKELDNQYQQRIRIINKIIHARGLPNELQFKVRTFFEYYFQVQQQQQVNFEELMAQMNHNLREEVQHELYFKYLYRSKFLRENFSQEFVRSLCFKLREQTFYPDDEVVQKGKIHNQLIIILSGSVQSFVPGKGKSMDIKLQDYDDGLLIGEREFFLKEQVQFGVKALSFVQTASLSDDDFFQMLSQHPKDQEKFCFLKDQYIFGDSTDFGIACEVCSSNHALNEYQQK